MTSSFVYIDKTNAQLFFILLISSQGKYVEIQFSRGGQPEGGRISNFLLEKVIKLFKNDKPLSGSLLHNLFMVLLLLLIP